MRKAARRRAINRRVTGATQPLAHGVVAEKYAASPLPAGLSVGMRLGAARAGRPRERESARRWRGRLFRDSIGEARFSAEEAHLARPADYRVEDINALKLPRAAYDIVFFHGSLHHVRQIERSSRRSASPSSPEASSTSTSTWGPSRAELTEESGASPAAHSTPCRADQETGRSSLYRCRSTIRPNRSVERHPPRGGPAVRNRRGTAYAGTSCGSSSRVRHGAPPAGQTGALSRLIAFEDHLLERNWVESYFRVIVARKR